MIIPTDVFIEVATDPIVAPIIEQAIADRIIEQYTIDYTCEGNEIITYLAIRKKYGRGEAACIAIARSWKCTVASDDMKATLKFCKDNGIELIGTLGILYDAYDKGIINKIDGQNILQDMIVIKKYTSPVSKFEDIINWFESGQGRELF